MIGLFLAHLGVLTALFGGWGNAEIHCHSVSPAYYGLAAPGHAYIRPDLCRSLWRKDQPFLQAMAVHTLAHELAHTRGFWRECAAENQAMKTWRFVARKLKLVIDPFFVWWRHYTLPALYHAC